MHRRHRSIRVIIHSKGDLICIGCGQLNKIQASSFSVYKGYSYRKYSHKVSHHQSQSGTRSHMRTETDREGCLGQESHVGLHFTQMSQAASLNNHTIRVPTPKQVAMQQLRIVHTEQHQIRTQAKVCMRWPQTNPEAEPKAARLISRYGKHVSRGPPAPLPSSTFL